MAAIATSRAMVNIAGVSEKVSVPDYSDPNFAVSAGQSTGSGAVNFNEAVTTEAGISKGLTNRTKEGIVGPYDPNFNVFH